MKAVVTGGAGFIGANLVHAMRRTSWVDEIVVVDDLSTGMLENLAGARDVEFLQGTILDSDLLDKALAGADAVVHLAAIPSVPRSVVAPVASHEANATGTLMVLEAARRAGGPQVIVASSSSVYGANPAMPKREDQYCMPVSPYAVSKLATETYALSYGQCYGMDVLPFRFFNVFGPLQPAGHAYAAVVPAFVDAALAGRPLPVHGDGLQSRDFTFVETVAATLMDAVKRRVSSDTPVNLALGTRTTLLDLIAEMERAFGHKLDVVHGPDRAGDVRNSQADSTRLRELFPDVEAVPLADGVRATIDWMASLQHAKAS